MKTLVKKHPLAIRWFHWINFPLLLLMIWSGILIYWAYPVYRVGFENDLAGVDNWARMLRRVVTFGRQGLFAHDNTHHALIMAYDAVDALRDDGRFDRYAWTAARQRFDRHVVED